MELQALLLVLFVEQTLSSELSILNDVDSDILKDEVWTWRCDGGNCRKGAVASGERPVGPATCKLACGDGALWPRPTGALQVSSALVRIMPRSVKLVSTPNADNTDAAEALMGAFEAFTEVIRSKDKSGTASGLPLEIYLDIKNPNIFKYTQGANESYQLNIKTSGEKVEGIISSENFLGARHGLETLSQLVVEDSASGEVLTSSFVEITDGPVYTHRGITLDTSRNFISKDYIKQTIDAMSYSKLNTFHWHITDSHSFPMQSHSFPNLTKFGAYSKNKVYSEEDIRELVRYGASRGVRLVPEFDAPAHVGQGWEWAEGAVVCFAAEPWQSYCVEPPCGQLDPTAEIAYTVLDGIYGDMAALFDTDHFHMGGDEVNLNCWNSTQHIVSQMEKLNLSRTHDGFHALWSMFQNRTRKMVGEKFGWGVKPVLWTSSLTESPILTKYLNSSDYIIQIWTKKDDKTIADLVNNGFQVILSNYDALYFDCGFGAWVGTGNNWCSPYIPWQKVYENDPSKILGNLGVDPSLHKLALGAEAALWTEQADDASIGNRIWPRGSAMGEALWSGSGKWQDAEHRLIVHRERLIERGIMADTLQPEWCSQNQGACYL